MLAALEEDLGVRLLRRSTRRMSLTPEGRGYLARCRQILADVEDADQSVARGQTVPRGKIRMTAPVLFGQRHVAPGLIDFAHRFDEVEVELLLLDRVINLIEEGIDVAVRIAHLADSSMIAVPVGHMRRVVCASPALLARQGTPAHPHELANFECVHFSGINPGESWNFLENGVGFSVRIQKNFTCNQAVAAAEGEFGHVEFKEGFVEALPIDDSWADVVISNGVMNLCPDKVNAYGELHRVLKPGGKLHIADILVAKAVPEGAKRDIDLWTG